MSYYIDQMLFSCPIKPALIKKNAIANPINQKGSISISCKKKLKTLSSKEIINELGGVYSKGRKVDLSNPDIEIRALLTNNKIYVGLKKAKIDRSQFEKRKVQFRPFFSPISLHPKFARTLVNLTGVKKNESFLDPFCGTGGLLIEAGLIGAKIIGSDIEKKMIEGCKKTLEYYNIKNYNLFCCDIGNIRNFVKKVDAIATDLPYGKSTTTKGENIKNLYIRTFENIYHIIKENKKVVVGLSDKEMISLGEKYLSLIEKHELRVHRSLTRYFVVYQK